MSLGWDVFANGLREQGLQDRLGEGVKAFVELYYRAYTQAVELDGGAYRRLHELVSTLMDSGLDDEWLNELINEVQEAMTGSLDCDGNVRPPFKPRPTEQE